MIPLYLSEGETEGMRGDIAFAQSCLETRNFTFDGSAVTIEQNNFCGMGVRYVKKRCAKYVEWLGQKENSERKGWTTGKEYGDKDSYHFRKYHGSSRKLKMVISKVSA